MFERTYPGGSCRLFALLAALGFAILFASVAQAQAPVITAVSAPRQVVTLNQNLTLEILGVDADGTQRVLSLPPSEVQYGCIGDVSKVVIAADTAKSVWWDVWLQDDAAQCAGQVRFALDAPSARMSIRKK